MNVKMSMNPPTGRRKILMVPEQAMLQLFMKVDIQPTFVRFWRPEVPESARVVSVHFLPEWCAFGVILEDESFEEVAPGVRLPEVLATYEAVTLARKQSD